ncbi:MAG: ABC transporter permease [Clostridia bacterium]|nr:ABC transporter permease [Clostridia bacterium]
MTSFLVGAIALATVFLFGCVGEIITEKAGHLNLGIPGIMCVGTAGGCYAVSIYMAALSDPSRASWFLLILLSILFAVIFAAALGGIYAVLTVSLRCNQNITGLAVTIFGNGFAQFFMDTCVLRSDADRANFEVAGKIISRGLPFADALGDFGKIFLSHGILVYLSIAIAIAAAWFLKRTRAGLHLRAVGENPATADAAGVNVTAYKYGAILIGSGIAGLGGYFYIMDYIKGSWENAATIEALGWLSVALVIFTLWKPNLSILGSFIFAALYVAAFYIDVNSTEKELLKLIPYVITVVVLIFTSIKGSKNNQAPASLGLSYFREER